LTTSEIREVVARWREAALRGLAAGYDIIEIHAAHGYLIHQFLSPLANQRTDAYGGDLAGRMRLCLEIVEAVRSAWPADKPVFMRVSAVDGLNSRWTMDDTVTLAREAGARGVDVLTTSSGGINGPGTATLVPRWPGYHVEYAERVRRESSVMTVAVGLITEPEQAEAILREGRADLVALESELAGACCEGARCAGLSRSVTAQLRVVAQTARGHSPCDARGGTRLGLAAAARIRPRISVSKTCSKARNWPKSRPFYRRFNGIAWSDPS
jgi:hypothetical protein